MRTNTLILYALFSFLGAATPITAWASERIQTEQIGVSIVADDGSVFARYDLADRSQRGKLRAYLEAERGRNYGIRVHNYTGGRIGLVIAVDGRNIISGRKSHLSTKEPMYVLGPYEQATYDGWRTSNTNVHRFIFTDAANSYADAWGDRSAMGVIAVTAFREVPRVQPQRRSGGQEMAPSASAPGESRSEKSMQSADAAEATGTGFGESHNSPSVRVHFKPQRHAFAKQFLKYEWRETLVRLGVIRESPPINRFWPEQLGQAQNYAPYPPGYWNQRR
ncbi:MAG: hypothetical protein GWP74_15460 [Proteobacteria bacterium]|nr:hypothetical protein [Pseudomonadota bacterium]